jgi:hypothetical protein
MLKCCVPSSYKILSLTYKDFPPRKQVTVCSVNHKKHIHRYSAENVDLLKPYIFRTESMYVSYRHIHRFSAEYIELLSPLASIFSAL